MTGASAVLRAERFLLRCTKPVLMGDVCEAIGLARTSSTRIRELLFKHLGDRLVEHVERGRTGDFTKFSIRKTKGRPPAAPKGAIFHMPKDLWRGWFNPATGITPPRLGFDK